jgi:DNA-binding transcriptional ArsR family regulator
MTRSRWFNYYRTMTVEPTKLPHPDREAIQLTSVLFALSDEARLTLVRQLSHGPLDMVDCSSLGANIPKSTRSHQVKVLREAGIVTSELRGRTRQLSLRRSDLDMRFPGLLEAVLKA